MGATEAAPVLYDPAEHRTAAGEAWSAARARAAIREITSDAVAAYRGPDALWPNHPAEDLSPAEDVPYRNVYFGAAGIAWALDRLAADGVGTPLPGAGELAATLPAGFRAAPELTHLETGTPPPAPSLLFGESGVLLVAEALGARGPDGAEGRAARRDRLADRVAANAENPTRELCWGSPGTLLAAAALHRASGAARWAELWRTGARWLLGEWRETVWEQAMYGERRRYVGAGHGFAGNALVLLEGADRLPTEEAAQLRERVAGTARGLAHHADGLAQWPGLADRQIPRRPVQWCHGAPGLVSSLSGRTDDAELEALLDAGAELTWRAGPLVKGAGLCHGTAGNGYALLARFAASGAAHWLERARGFGMDAAAHVAAERRRTGRGRHGLFTGDLGVALYLNVCLNPAPERCAFPFLTGALER